MTDEAGADWNTAGYLRDARFVPELGRPVLAWLAPGPGERILDVGCGDGALTAEIAASGADVVGIDASLTQVAAARARGLDARTLDAAALPFREAFDAVFSNAALHWMPRYDTVLAGVAAALRRGGRFVGEMGGRGNIDRVFAAIAEALGRRGLDARAASPWVFPGPNEFSAALTGAGLRVVRIEHFERPTPIDCTMTDWLAVFAPAFAQLVPAADRPDFYTEVAAGLEAELFDPARGGWWVDYVRLRFEALRP